jgi:hypothetical protein
MEKGRTALDGTFLRRQFGKKARAYDGTGRVLALSDVNSE